MDRAAGVSEANAADIVRKAGVRELHGSARVAMRSRMKFLNPDVSFDARQNSVLSGDQVTVYCRDEGWWVKGFWGFRLPGAWRS
jgi:copper homeostasis protein CutC